MHLESIGCLVVAVVALVLWLREKRRAFGLVIKCKALQDSAAFVVESAKLLPVKDGGMIEFGFLRTANEEAWLARYTLWWGRRFLRNTKGLSAMVEAKELAVRELEKSMLWDLQKKHVERRSDD